MSNNPFQNRFDNNCGSCGDMVHEGDAMFAHEGIFVCHSCANSNGNICGGKCLGNYKKSEYDLCFTCNEKLVADGVPF